MNFFLKKKKKSKMGGSGFAILEIAVEMMNYVCGAWVLVFIAHKSKNLHLLNLNRSGHFSQMFATNSW